MKKSISATIAQSLSLAFIVLLSCNSSMAMTVCLYARATNDPTIGHSFVTVAKDKGQIFETYGLWPVKKYAHSIAINYISDLPLQVLQSRKNVILPPDLLEMKEAHLCREVDNKELPRVREIVRSYIQVYGPYRTLQNNCTHFAIRIYNAATGDKFPVVITPKKAIKLIESLNN